MSQINLKLVNLFKQLKIQVAKRQKGSLELLGEGTSTPIVDVVPPMTALQPSNPKKRDRPTKASHPRMETGSSSSSPSVFGERLQLAQGVQVAMTPKEESIIAAISISDLVVGLAEMLIHSLMVTRMLGGELERNSVVVVAKLKSQLDESSSSLKSTLKAMGALDEKCRQANVEADEANSKGATLEA